MSDDFNTMLAMDDRINGNPVHISKTNDFTNFMVEVGMEEIRSI